MTMQQPPTGYDSWLEWVIEYVRRDLETAAPGEMMECNLARAELAELKRDRERLEWRLQHPTRYVESREEIDDAMEASGSPSKS